ncbi:MAG: ribosomal protein S18-alanine N-acetyltransferase [Bacillota bacterium]|nr:ribosomal protein S18-alanine N-acetyltransferase [Bacillota bacterium]
MNAPGAADELEVRRMNLEDLDQVLTIEERSFPTPWTRQAFASELCENERALYLVAVEKGKVVGYVGMWLVLDEAHVTTLAVHPDRRRVGIGRRLLREAMHWARERGSRRMTLEVRVSNLGAQRLYQEEGFRRVGIRPGYYQDNDEDAVIMWKEDL